MTTAVDVTKDKAKNAHALLERLKPSIATVLPKHLTPERMAMIAFTAMRQNPKLLDCSAQSIIGSIMTAAMLGLEPSGPLGHGALIPYKGECQFQPMYQGLLELARRSGLIKDVQLRAVYKGDTYRFAFGLEPFIEHVPLEGDGADNPDRECTHVYCIIRFTNGGIQWDQMSYAQGIAHGKKFSKSYYQGKFTPGTPWAEHPVAMCLKTILKQTLKLCPKSPELASAMVIDDLGEVGRIANAKKLTDGSIDVDFEPDPEPQPEREHGKVDLDEVRPAKEENRGHGAEKLDTVKQETKQPEPETKQAQGETRPPVVETKPGVYEEQRTMPAPPIPAITDPEAGATADQFNFLEKECTRLNVNQSAMMRFVKEATGAIYSKLKQKDLERIVKWIRNGGKE